MCTIDDGYSNVDGYSNARALWCGVGVLLYLHHHRRSYAAVSFMDEQVGRLVDQLETLGQTQETIGIAIPLLPLSFKPHS